MPETYTKTDRRASRADHAEGNPSSTAGADNASALTVPCPLCRHVTQCPRAGAPTDECLVIWPLGRPQNRSLDVTNPQAADLKERALRTPGLREIVAAWLAGDRITDEQYLHLRSKTLEYYDEPKRNAWGYVLLQFLQHLVVRYVKDALRYYGYRPEDSREFRLGCATAIEGAIVIPREDVVAKDAGSPVASHFERLFCDVLKLCIWKLWGIEHRGFPSKQRAFRESLEDEWAKALAFGNGHFGLTVIPRISIPDMVRYQQLGGGDDVVSWSVANYIIWQMDIFPMAVQLVVPQIRELAFGRRLVSMFDPLVQSLATEADHRQRWADPEAPHLGRAALAEEFKSVLSAAIEEYDFMHGKDGGVADGVGVLGLESSPEIRGRVDANLERLGIPMRASELCHVGLPRHVGARLRAHLREHFPPPPRASATRLSLDAPLDDGDDGQTLGDLISDSGDALFGAYDEMEGQIIDGVQYLYVEQMARWCGVSDDQLRRWDDTGELQSMRLQAISPAHRGKESGKWRVYPKTPDMKLKVQTLAETKLFRRGRLKREELSRPAAAEVLGISVKTLKRWEDAGIARPTRRDGRPIYSADEVARLNTQTGRHVGPKGGRKAKQ